MVKRKAPYRHEDKSDCYTKNCSRNTLNTTKTGKDEFIQEWFSPESSNTKTYINTIASQEDFDKAVADGEVSRQRHPIFPYSIYKYSQVTTFRKNWNDITLASRGLVVNDETGEIVARPFSKFFNYNEPSTPTELMRGRITVAEKLDGSLGISMLTPEGMKITTAGGFQSPQGAHATKLYQEKYEGKWKPRKGVTYMWEIIYPENRIVLDYGEEDDLHLLGAVEIKSGKSIPLSNLKEWKWKRATEHKDYASLDSVVNSGDRSNHEGYVVHYLDTDVRVKYKHEEYLNHHRYATGINSRRIWEMLKSEEDFSGWKQNAPEEFEGYITTTQNEIQTQFDDRVKLIHKEYESFLKTIPSDINTKDYAEAVKTNAPADMKQHFFNLRSHGKISTSGIRGVWDYIKPPFESSFWSMNNGKE